MDPIITIDNLSKRYIISHKEQERYTALRDTLVEGTKRISYRFLHPFSTPNNNPSREEFWALKDINLDIRQGDRVGIIGRNGAGKSTLLKVLSRITAPTTGRIEIAGRVASLLEVGTGFHPELTGGENIFLNGAILGMSRSDIKKNFDEIVAFAEVEKFLDTPVKRYSSGMYVRLAFAVAAHLESEILIVDEVLAVGDAQFQKKCLTKMGDIGKEGRTVMFVSHNMAAIRSLCNTGIVLNSGEISHRGGIADCIYHYGLLRNTGNEGLGVREGVKVTDMAVNSRNSARLTSDSSVDVSIQLETTYLLPRCFLNLVIEDPDGRVMIHSRTDMFDAYPTLEAGNHKIDINLGRISLSAGVYSVWFRLYCNTDNIYEVIDSDRQMIEVEGPQIGGLIDVTSQWLLNGKSL